MGVIDITVKFLPTTQFMAIVEHAWNAERITRTLSTDKPLQGGLAPLSLLHQELTIQTSAMIPEEASPNHSAEQMSPSNSVDSRESTNSGFFIEEKKSIPLPKEYRKQLKAMKIGKSKKECTICMNNFKEGEVIRQLPCKHIFHHCCVKPWFQKKSTCPNCRYDLLDHFEARDKN
eukprot:TRINITY_DN7453_c0_g1_i2.p1 TRINITY_DN7453_c0_g1~~TRINITY_DN7453_c0_g1_i2.p1  ORF type:complete len:175 (-),score=12.08 TRINITY_DN7453_c0_g1_i2:311-835(-)